jgi:hypothetical protein
MATIEVTAIDTDPCPCCGRAEGARWVASTPDTATGSCRHCGTEWTITVDIPGTP